MGGPVTEGEGLRDKERETQRQRDPKVEKEKDPEKEIGKPRQGDSTDLSHVKRGGEGKGNTETGGTDSYFDIPSYPHLSCYFTYTPFVLLVGGEGLNGSAETYLWVRVPMS